MKHIWDYDRADTELMHMEGLWDSPQDTWENDPWLFSRILASIQFLIWRFTR
jgi:hypothetical protein